MQIALLGPVAAVGGDGEALNLGGTKQRGLLAMLALRPNRPVGVAALLEGLWCDAAPRGAAASVQAYVSRLRRILEPARSAGSGASVLGWTGAGYILAAGPETTDVQRFGRLRDEARAADRAGDSATAATLLGWALDLWRGEALADVAALPFARGAAAQLERQRLDVLEEGAQALLRVGRHDEAVARLTADQGRWRDREQLWALLMLAHYRVGRQVEALATYQALRAHLCELGVEPGPKTRALQAAILRHDASLEAVPATGLHHPGPRVPQTWTSFVGRSEAQREVAALLRRERLVTLTGVGGAARPDWRPRSRRRCRPRARPRCGSWSWRRCASRSPSPGRSRRPWRYSSVRSSR